MSTTTHQGAVGAETMTAGLTLTFDPSKLFDTVAGVADGGAALGCRIVGIMLASGQSSFREDVGLAFYGVTATPAPRTDGGMTAGEDAVEAMRARKDAAYEERNKVVAALARLFPSGLKKTDIPGWDAEWHGAVYIDLPTGQVSWHFHDSQAHLFDGLPPYAGEWDGHDTPEKYARLAALSATPAQPTGAVPDSLRALSEAATQGEWLPDVHVYYDEDGGPSEDRTEGVMVLDHDDQPDSIIQCSERDAAFIVALVKWFRALASHPAGQSAGSGADILAATLAEFQRRNGYHKREIEELLTEFAELLLSKVKPAPDSTRTGDEGTVSVPVEPTEEMWSGLARQIVMWHRGARPTGANLHRDLKNCGWPIPDWLKDEIEDADYVPPKGAVAVAIYRAMIAARPAAPEAQGAWRSQAADEIDAIADLWSGDGRSYAKTIAAILRAEEPEQLPPADAETKRQVQRAWDRFKAGTSAPPASSGQGGR
jgi:hypothetical protein